MSDRALLDVHWRWQDLAPETGPATVLVVDVLRATTSIVTALAAGAAAVLPVETVAAARALREEDPSRLLAGEREAHPIPGFDLGNSPAGMFRPELSGREVVMTTTNGTRALLRAAAVAAGGTVAALALVNVEAVAAAVGEAEPGDLHILCAGTAGRHSIDDAYVAGAVVDALWARAGDRWDLSDAALTARWLYRGAPERPFAVLAAAAAGRHLMAKGYRGDVEFCAQRDAFAVVPRWRDGALRRA